MLHWLVSFLGRGRAERTATEQQIFGRAALQRLEHGAADLVSPPDPEQMRRGRGARRAELEARGSRRSGSPTPASAAPTSGEPVDSSCSRHSKLRGRRARSCSAIASRAHLGRMNTPSASTVTPSASEVSPLA